jgi:hypothetical protein
LVAVLDARDQWHARCAEVFPDVIARLLTTEAVLTEACHLVLPGGSAHVPLDFLIRAGIPIMGLDTAAQHRASALMRVYTQLPMDYADATLVVLAEALQLSTVFTTDRRGFLTYRLPRRKRFHLLPS